LSVTTRGIVVTGGSGKAGRADAKAAVSQAYDEPLRALLRGNHGSVRLREH
jgi:hypothetical protein